MSTPEVPQLADPRASRASTTAAHHRHPGDELLALSVRELVGLLARSEAALRERPGAVALEKLLHEQALVVRELRRRRRVHRG